MLHFDWGCPMCCLKLAVGEVGLRVELCAVTISLSITCSASVGWLHLYCV